MKRVPFQLTFGAGPDEQVIPLSDMRGKGIRICNVTVEIVTAAGTTPLMSICSRSKEEGVLDDLDHITDAGFSSNAAGFRQGWDDPVGHPFFPNESEWYIRMRDFNGGVLRGSVGYHFIEDDAGGVTHG